ncbi:HTH-type transcriptional repressor RspR [Antarctobacter heliothermus]|uniref:HTH-type transcriptional repressor RspR n=1 Tax=Antarctobacter heliothermus TaxID=74033 RepID=A0A222E4A0_9RHOB|nr:HTH-type transcriptional repressor RspR [Antarctobacter heliothermus]
MVDGTLPEQIATRLRRDILRGKLPPGTPVKERDHAAELGVSRTPMREAIRMLAKEGLVQLRPARSPIVAKPSFEEVAHNIEVMAALEVLSVRLTCQRASDPEIDEIADVANHMQRDYDSLDRVDLFELDMRAFTGQLRGRLAIRFWTRPTARCWRGFGVCAICRPAGNDPATGCCANMRISSRPCAPAT